MLRDRKGKLAASLYALKKNRGAGSKERIEMWCGVVSSGSNIALYLHPKGHHTHLSAARTGGRGGGGWSRPLPRSAGRWAGVCCSSSGSSSFRTQAVVEEVSEIERSFYELLGIPETGSFDEIKRAYKRMALKYHPDVSPPELAKEHTRLFLEVQEAYETLSDPSTRALYDRDLATGFHLAFSRKRLNEEFEEKTRWRNRWEDQLAGLKKRSMNKDSEEKLSWAARMRKQGAKSSME